MKMRYRRHSSNTTGAIIVIGVGVLLLLNQNGIVRFEDVWRLWPMLLVIAGAARMSQGGSSAQMVGGLMMAVGVVLELAEFHLIPYRVWDLWPLGIIAVGLMLLWRSLQPKDDDDLVQDNPRNGPQSRRVVFNGPAPDNLSIFGGGERRISDSDFTRADVLAIFGGYKLDLRKAAMKGSSAKVEAVALFGGVEIVVPENWNVVVRGVGIFGGYADESHHPSAREPAPALIVEGVALFGGVNIKN